MTQPLDFDDALPHVGEFGRYQYLLFLALAPFCLNLVLVYFVHIFATLEPDHQCEFPVELTMQDWSEEMIRNLSIPWEPDGAGGGRWSRCQIYDVDFSNVVRQNVTSADPAWPTKDCGEWRFDLSTSGGYGTMASELGWVCGRGWYANAAQSAFFAGAIVGGLVTGWAADRYGRVPVLIATNLVGAASALLSATASDLTQYVIYRVIAGTSFDTLFVLMYVLALEYTGPKHRTLVANLSIALFYTAGTVALPWLSVWVGHWRLLYALSAAPMILSCLGFWILPESARWLLAQGRVDEAVVILKSIARVNNRSIPAQVIEGLEMSYEAESSQDIEKAATLLDLLKTPRLRHTTIAICLLWMLLSLSYDGHVRNVSNLPLDIFVSFSVTAATELPADAFLLVTLDRWGRRWLAFGTLMLSGVLTVLTLATAGNNIGIAVLAVLGRFCVNIAYNIGLQFAAELIPTTVRAQGVAAVHIMGYVAALLSPLVVEMGKTSPFLPLVVLGLASCAGGCLALVLPETLHRDLPQTLQDGEDFGRDQKCCSAPCLASSGEERLRSGEVSRQPSFIRRRVGHRPSIRGETYRSSLIRHRREVIYIPSAD